MGLYSVASYSSTNVVPLCDTDLQAQDTLLSFLVGDEQIKGSLASSCVWYTRYLQSQFRVHWYHLSSSLSGLEDNRLSPGVGDLAIVYKFLLVVASLLKARKDLALVEIVDELDNRGMLKSHIDDDERAMSNQLVFATIGWLTMLYEPASDPKASKLEVTKTTTSASGYRNPMVTRKYFTFKQSFDYIDSTLDNLLSRFGDLIPEPCFTENEEPSGIRLTDNIIMASSVCLSTIQQLSGLNIEWVTSLALHLELDLGKKTLKVFRFPSFCRLMATQQSTNVLSRLFQDHALRTSGTRAFSGEFFREMLLSYRLIFGQDERSWEAFSRMQHNIETSRDEKDWDLSWNSDPMLATLCGKGCTTGEARAIYDEIEVDEPAKYYEAHAEFSYLGHRLLDLQRFVQTQAPSLLNPQTLRELLIQSLNDRGRGEDWWTQHLLVGLVAVLVSLMIVLLVIESWQLKITQQGSRV